MASVKKIEVINSAKGPTLRVFSGGRWYYMDLSLRERIPKKSTKFNRLRPKKVLETQIGGAETVEGGASSGAPAILNTNKLVSLCTTTATNKYFKLDKGTEGQIKYIVYSSEANPSDEMILSAFTQYSSAGVSTVTVASLHTTITLIYDGSTWNLTGEVTGAAEINITT